MCAYAYSCTNVPAYVCAHVCKGQGITFRYHLSAAICLVVAAAAVVVAVAVAAAVVVPHYHGQH